MVFGQNYHLIRGGGFVGPCVQYCCCPLCTAMCTAPGLRSEIRFKFNLEEAPMSDFLTHCCFLTHPCAVCQCVTPLPSLL